MKTGIFTVKDTKVGSFLNPFFSHHAGTAVRALERCLVDPTHDFALHPGDYDLYELGYFDDETGVITPFHEPQRIACLSEYYYAAAASKRMQDALINQAQAEMFEEDSNS